MEQNKLRELPIAKFNRSADLSLEEKKDILKYLEELTCEYPGKNLEINPERKIKIEKQLDNLVEWVVVCLNLPVSDNLPFRNKLKIFSQEDYKRIHPDYPDESGGSINTKSKEILGVSCEGYERHMFHNINHELVHAISRVTHWVDSALLREGNLEDALTVRMSGYRNLKNDTFFLLNEMVTEMINIEVLNYLREKGGEDLLTGISVSAYDGVILFDMLFKKTAEKLGMDLETFREAIYRGYFLGNLKTLSCFDEAFGKGALKRLAEIREISWKSIRLEDFCKRFEIDINEFENKCNEYEASKEIELLGGIKLKRQLLPAVIEKDNDK